jgi:hypothetical protein
VEEEESKTSDVDMSDSDMAIDAAALPRRQRSRRAAAVAARRQILDDDESDDDESDDDKGKALQASDALKASNGGDTSVLSWGEGSRKRRSRSDSRMSDHSAARVPGDTGGCVTSPLKCPRNSSGSLGETGIGNLAHLQVAKRVHMDFVAAAAREGLQTNDVDRIAALKPAPIPTPRQVQAKSCQVHNASSFLCPQGLFALTAIASLR